MLNIAQTAGAIPRSRSSLPAAAMVPNPRHRLRCSGSAKYFQRGVAEHRLIRAAEREEQRPPDLVVIGARRRPAGRAALPPCAEWVVGARLPLPPVLATFWNCADPEPAASSS